MKPILIMSSERSGSNLLRHMLGAHSQISAPPPAHLWPNISKHCHLFGDLTNKDNLRALTLQAIKLTNTLGSHLAWGYDIDPDEVIENVSHKTISGLLGALYDDYAKKHGTSMWVCKEIDLFDYALNVRSAYPSTKILYLCRDGRDFAGSVKKVASHDQHVFAIAHQWKRQQVKCLAVFQELSDLGCIRVIRYEDLITKPERHLRSICEFVGTPFESEMLNFHKTADARSDADKSHYWTNLKQPVMSDNQQKFLKELTPREISIVEAVAGDVLEILGYKRMTEKPQRISYLQSRWYGFQNRVLTRRNRRRFLAEPGRKERQSARRDYRKVARHQHASIVET